MKLAIHPEPADQERDAVVLAIERLGALAPEPESPWGRLGLALDDEAWDDSAPRRPSGGRRVPRA